MECPSCHSTWLRPVPSTGSLTCFLGDRRIVFQARGGGDVSRPRHPFQCALFCEPEVKSLRKRYPILQRLEGGTQWESQRSLLRLLRADLFPMRPPPAVLRQLGLWTVCRTNHHWFCSHFAYLYTVFSAALGWVARILNIGADHAADSSPHMVCEVWNDEFQKWVVVDPLLAAWFSHRRKPGTPLGFLEIRKAWLSNRARDVRAHYGVEENARQHAVLRKEQTMPAHRHATVLHPSVYFWGAAHLSNRFLTDPYENRGH